jgi:hypothetical protein
MNLLLAAVCDKYQQEHDRHADALKSLRDDNAAAAFKLLGKKTELWLLVLPKFTLHAQLTVSNGVELISLQAVVQVMSL